ncbi:hypothetical protein QYS48_34020 [Marivirga arenosa]|uniref:Outer membrane protein beta-barrel domain-containing protein n=1 Tax=Marivirga arenosa TaxID=3059076 RepID=A0AA51N698_9BACT|nr:hypothetical protein [Marivirga sp. ABR2-2]WMN06858.1 hypothetical protein QYS48_34020 [Marivirga sp. ABR2-2]
MKRHIKLSLLFLFISFASVKYSNAQSNYIEGFYINNQGDTINSKIYYSSGQSAFRNCQVLVNENKSKTFTPEDILGYGYLNDASYSSNIIESFFLRDVINGKVSLYEKENEYFISVDDSVYHIKNSAEIANRNGKRYVINQNVWKGKLYYLTKDYPNLKRQIDKMSFRKNDIKAFVIQLNKMKNEKYIDYDIKLQTDKIKWGIRIGHQFNRINKTSSVNFPHLNETYKSQSQTFALIFDYKIPEFSKSLSITSEISISKISFSGNRDDQSTFPRTLYISTFNYTQLSIPIALSYRFNQDKLFVKTYTGFNSQFTINESYLFERITIFTDERFSTTDQAFTPTLFQPGLIFGFSVGYEFKNFEAGLDNQLRISTKLNKEINLYMGQQFINSGLYIKF